MNNLTPADLVRQSRAIHPEWTPADHLSYLVNDAFAPRGVAVAAVRQVLGADAVPQLTVADLGAAYEEPTGWSTGSYLAYRRDGVVSRIVDHALMSVPEALRYAAQCIEAYDGVVLRIADEDGWSAQDLAAWAGSRQSGAFSEMCNEFGPPQDAETLWSYARRSGAFDLTAR